jgi:transposase
VVLDNLPVDEVAGIREAITTPRAQLFYLPPYRPDIQPTRMALTALKALLRRYPLSASAS